MSTGISQKSRETAMAELERLKKENEALRANQRVTDIVQGQGFMSKEGEDNHHKIFLKLFQVDPRTEFPLKGNEIERNGHKYREYLVGKWLWADETEVIDVFTGKAKSFRIYFERSRGR